MTMHADTAASAFADAMIRILRPDRPRAARPVRGRRATFRPVRDDSLRGLHWVPLG